MAAINDDFFLAPERDACGARILNPQTNPTVLLVWAANRFNRSASRHYQTHFGINAMDWRMLAMLCKEPGIQVSAASPQIGYDKGAVSRSLANLAQMDLARFEIQGTNARNRQWFLTDKGLALYNRILDSALVRQQRLLEGFSMEEVLTLNSMLRRFMENLEQLDSDS